MVDNAGTALAVNRSIFSANGTTSTAYTVNSIDIGRWADSQDFRTTPGQGAFDAFPNVTDFIYYADPAASGNFLAVGDYSWNGTAYVAATITDPVAAAVTNFSLTPLATSNFIGIVTGTMRPTSNLAYAWSFIRWTYWRQRN